MGTRHRLPCHDPAGGRGSKQGAASCTEESTRAAHPLPHRQHVSLILTAEISPWDHCPSSTALAGMAPTCGAGEEH